MRIFATIFAGLVGLAFGSFLNVCLSRWPEDESVVSPRSHCRHCDHVLAWWENIPLASWIALGGRCRRCKAKIGLRYLLVELAVGVLWALEAWQAAPEFSRGGSTTWLAIATVHTVFQMAFTWMLVALAALDAAELWLPNFLTLPGVGLGLAAAALQAFLRGSVDKNDTAASNYSILLGRVAAIIVAAGLVLLIRWLYWLVRRQEGIGLGDAKLMAMLGAWLGLSGTLLAFTIASIAGFVAALVLLAVLTAHRNDESWGTQKLPFGTFLCIGGVVSSLWGQAIVAGYLRFAGL